MTTWFYGTLTFVHDACFQFENVTLDVSYKKAYMLR